MKNILTILALTLAISTHSQIHWKMLGKPITHHDHYPDGDNYNWTEVVIKATLDSGWWYYSMNVSDELKDTTKNFKSAHLYFGPKSMSDYIKILHISEVPNMISDPSSVQGPATVIYKIHFQTLFTEVYLCTGAQIFNTATAKNYVHIDYQSPGMDFHSQDTVFTIKIPK